jgi:hypothetical protein
MQCADRPSLTLKDLATGELRTFAADADRVIHLPPGRYAWAGPLPNGVMIQGSGGPEDCCIVQDPDAAPLVAATYDLVG